MSAIVRVKKFIKKTARSVIRTVFSIRDGETISDGLERHRLKLKKKFDKRTATLEDLKAGLAEVGIRPGDTLLVHASWRGCYMLKATPEEVVQCLLDYLGKDGTLLMPCYGNDYTFLDVKNTPSAAGALSECFRRCDGVVRSCFPVAAMCGKGRLANVILSEHVSSEYAFDSRSPYYKAVVQHNAKVLLLGMGKKPHKISAFHCASNECRSAFYQQVYQKQTQATVIDDSGTVHKILYKDRLDSYGNSKRTFRKLFTKTPHLFLEKNGVSIIAFQGADAYQTAKTFCEQGGILYRKKLNVRQ